MCFHTRARRFAEVCCDDGKHHADQQAHEHIREQQRHVAEYPFDKREDKVAQGDKQQPGQAARDPLLFTHPLDAKPRRTDDAKDFHDLINRRDDAV